MLALVGEKQVARLIDLDITVVVEFQVRSGIEVAQRAALLEDVFGLAQPLDVEFRKIQRLARNAPEAKSTISFLFHEKVKFDDQPKSRHWFE